MGKKDFKDYICLPFCNYFRNGQKEDMACRGAQVIEMLIRSGCMGGYENLPRQGKEPCLWEENDSFLETIICQSCSFREKYCDFHSSNKPPSSEPCGGYILLLLLKQSGKIDLTVTLRRPQVNKQNWRSSYLRLHPLAALKRLELPYIYHIGSDELFEIDDKAQMFMARCNGSYMGAELTSDAEFAEYCLKEGLLEALPHPDHITVSVDHAPEPSLRYLEIELLHRCNLKCRHCYLDQSCQEELSLDDAIKIAKEFASNGGLRLLISGGEPLLYPHLKDFLAETSGLKLRRVLLTNGTLITEDNTAWLKVENIQFSLDGWRQGHDLLRGKGNFERTIQGINAARQAGIPVSIATMIHKGNINEFERMESFVREIGATEWGIDVPCVTGSLKLNNDLIVPRERGASLMKFAFGGSYHGPSDGFACGRHLMTVLPTGRAVKCGFYEADSLGDAREGLIDCWLRLKHIPLDALECKGCPVVNECAGGCRFRAPHPFAPDPVMCAFYGICGECKG